MRLFVAIEFSEEIKQVLFSAIASLKQQGATANFTRRENMHLTLAFIGESNRAEQIKSCLDGISAEAFTLALEKGGNFGNLYWVGVAREPKLNALAAAVRSSLKSLGIPIDEKPFRPHITVARELSCVDTPRIEVAAASMKVGEIVLMRSDRINGKLVYTPIHKVKLK